MDISTNLMVIGLIWLIIKFLLYPYILGFLEILFKNKYTFIFFLIVVALAFWKPDYFIPKYKSFLLSLVDFIQMGYSYIYDFIKEFSHDLLYID